MPNNACVFLDLDGTLLNIEEKYYKSHTSACKIVGLHPKSRTEYWALKRMKVPESQIVIAPEDLFKKYNEIRINNLESKAYLDLDKPIDGVENLLKLLNKQRVLLYIATMRRHTDRVYEQIRNLKFHNYFQEVLASSVHVNPAEDKAALIYTKYQEYKNYTKQYMVGDTEADIQCGKILGFQTVGVLSGIRNKDLLENAAPNYLLKSVSELATILS